MGLFKSKEERHEARLRKIEELNAKVERMNANKVFSIGTMLNGQRGHPDDVQRWCVFDKDSYNSTTSTVGRAVIGWAIAGGLGAVIGGMTGNDKNTFLIKVTFSNCSGIFQMDDAQYQKMLKIYGDKMEL